MDEHKNPVINRLNEKLPTHSPDPGLWHNLSAKLDMLDANTALQEKLGQLPVHSPDPGTWNGILSRLNRIAYYKNVTRIALSAAAGLLLFFTVSRFIDTNQPAVAPQQASVNQAKSVTNPTTSATNPASAIGSRSATAYADKVPEQDPGFTPTSVSTIAALNARSATDEISLPVTGEQLPAIAENTDALNQAVAAADETIRQTVAQILPAVESEPTAAENYNTNTGPRIVQPPADVHNAIVNPTVKYYTPEEPGTANNKNYFALAMNYLPENVYNGTDNTIFHNVDLTASYNKEKVRYNTSLGMAYNEGQFQVEMNYNVNTPVTAPGPGGTIDTISYTTRNIESEYQGTEKHQYITYNIGLGKRLFASGKFSSWINAGAGFGIQLNDPDLIASTTNSIKGQNNTMINSVSSDKPIYNDYNINFVTGIDFNYQIIKRLSISFAPTSRWYFKPLLTKDNQATDELSLGFRTGMKFDF